MVKIGMLFGMQLQDFVELPMQIQFVGWTFLERNLPFDAKIMKECLSDYNEEVYLSKYDFLFN